MTVRRGILFDYGGVLTRPVADSFTAFERANGIDPGSSYALLLAASRTPDGGPIAALERGEMSVAMVDELLTCMLAEAGYGIPARGSLLEGLFARMTPNGGLWSVAARARAAGVVTGLLSNSWGTSMYPWKLLENHFDLAVISGQVGLRKPDAAIYRLALERAGVEPSHCAFVDDREDNVDVARTLGMHGIVHDGDDVATAAALTGFLSIDLPVG